MPSKLRRNPVLGALLLGFGLLALVVTIATLTKGPAAPAQPFTYSDLRASIQQREVKSATLRPALGKVDVVLKDGKEHVVGYSPTDETLADRLAASGAQVDVSSRGSFPWGGLMIIFGIFVVVGLVLSIQQRRRRPRAG